MKKYSKLMAVLLVVAMLLPGMAQAAPVTQPKVMRVGGESRVGTSIKLSEVAMETAKEAVLVGFGGEADALTGAILAKAKNAPLFFVRDSEVETIKARLDKLGVNKVHVLGGKTVFAEELMNKFNDYNPARITGENRYETAIAVAEKAIGKKADTVFLAKGNGDLADALAIGAISAKESKPLLLTHDRKLTDVTKQALKDMGVKNVEIVGGESAVHDTVKKELEDLGYKVGRTAGDNRQATSVEIAKKFNKNASQIVIANGFKYADAVTAGYFAADKNAVVLLINENAVHPSVKEYLEENKLDTTVLGQTSAVSGNAFGKVVEYLDGVEVEAPVEKPVEKDLKVESVSAINAKTVEVKFNKAVEDTSKATVELLRGTFKQNATVKWAEDKKSVQLVGANNLQAGDYTVNVKGLTEEVLTGTVKIEAQKVASIEILDEVAVVDKVANANGIFDANTEATVSYIVKDQYGTDITKTTDLKTNDTMDTTIKAVKAKGIVELSGNVVGGKKVGDIVAIVLIDSSTGVSTSKTVKLSAKSTVSEIEVTGVYNAKGEKVALNDKSKASEAFIVLNLKDQYGKEITEVSEASGLVITNTNKTNLTVKEDTVVKKKIGDKDKLVIEIESILKAGNTDILLISTTNGKSAKYTVEVAETTTTDAITVSQPEIAVAGEETLIPITVMDKEGNVITDKKLLANKDKGIKVGGKEVLESAFEVKDGQVYYKIKFDDKGTQALVFQTSTFKVATITINVKAKAEAAVVRGLKKPLVISKAQKSAKITVEDYLVIEDQYGREMKKVTDTTNPVTVKLVGEKSEVVSVGTNDNTVTALKNGTAKLNIKLVTEFTNTNNTKIDSAVEVDVRVTDGKEYDGYEIAPIGKVQATKEGLAKEFTVNGLLNGGKVALKSGEYTATISGGKGLVDAKDGNFKVATTNLSKDKDGKEIDTEFTLKVTINATGEVLEQKFTASKDEPKTEEYFFTTTATGDETNYKEAKEITNVVAKGGVYKVDSKINVDNADAVLNIATVDQYGNKVVEAINTAKVKVTITPEKAAEVDVTDNGTGNAKAVLVKDVAEAKLTAKVKVGNATKELKVVLKAEVAEEVALATKVLGEAKAKITEDYKAIFKEALDMPEGNLTEIKAKTEAINKAAVLIKESGTAEMVKAGGESAKFPFEIIPLDIETEKSVWVEAYQGSKQVGNGGSTRHSDTVETIRFNSAQMYLDKAGEYIVVVKDVKGGEIIKLLTLTVE